MTCFYTAEKHLCIRLKKEAFMHHFCQAYNILHLIKSERCDSLCEHTKNKSLWFLYQSEKNPWNPDWSGFINVLEQKSYSLCHL